MIGLKLSKITRSLSFQVVFFSFLSALLLSSCGMENNIGCDIPFHPKGFDSSYTKFCQVIPSAFKLEEATELAKEGNRHVLVYFSSIACTTCRDFEKQVLMESLKKEIISNGFILCVLFTDEQALLPKTKNIISSLTKKKLNTVGQYNADLQISLVQQGHQPVVCIVDSDGVLIDIYTGELFNKGKFLNWVGSHAI
jgi:thioredoxin-related protein